MSKREQKQNKDPEFEYSFPSTSESDVEDPPPINLVVVPAEPQLDESSIEYILDPLNASSNTSMLSKILKVVTDISTQQKEIIERLDKQDVVNVNIQTVLCNVVAEQKKIKIALRNYETNNHQDPEIVYDIVKHLPFKKYEDILEYEKTMNADEVRNYLQTIGGATIQRALYALVAKVFDVELQVRTTWMGTKAGDEWLKKPLNCLNISKMIIGKLI